MPQIPFHHSSSNNLLNEKAARYKNLLLEMICKSIFLKESISLLFWNLKSSNIFFSRSCGSTVGPMLSKIGIRTVDVGNAMLSMHSIRETAGSQDVQSAIDLFVSFFEGFSELDKELTVD